MDARRRRSHPPLVPRVGGGRSSRPASPRGRERSRAAGRATGPSSRRSRSDDSRRRAVGQGPALQGRRLEGESGVPPARPVYLAAGKTVDDLISDAGLDERSERRVRFSAENVLDALAPTNFPALNPAALKATLDTGGRNLVQGSASLVHDLRKPPHIPAMVDTNAFTVGKDLAVTPGAVVFRTELFELIQYEPSTPKVRETAAARPADDQQVLHRRRRAGPGACSSTSSAPARRCFRNRGATRTSAMPNGARRLRLHPCSRRSMRSRPRSPAPRVARHGAVRGRSPRAAVGHLAATEQLDRIAGLTLGVCVLDNETPGRWARSSTTRRRPRRSPSPSANCTSTAARSRACSPGCGPTTWCGTTG